MELDIVSFLFLCMYVVLGVVVYIWGLCNIDNSYERDSPPRD